MVVLWLFVVVLFVVLLWLMWTPLILCINTYENQYYLSLGGLIVVSPYQRNDGLYIKLKVPFYSFFVEISQPNSKDVKQQKAARKSRSAKSGKIKKIRMILDFIQTFTVKHFYIDVDTDNYVLNAQLIPIFLGLSQGNAHLRTNFVGKANLWLEVENRLIRFVKPAVKYLLGK